MVADYDGVSPSHSISDLTSGLYYKIAVVALNAEGSSDKSTYITIATSELPDQPLAIVKNTDLSDQTSLYL